MNYIEWLRVRNCLRTTAIVLIVFVAIAGALRISFSRYMSPQQWVQRIEREPGTTQSQVVLPDGTKRTTLDNPGKRTHVVIDDRGSAGTHITITEPSSRHDDGSDVHIGGTHVTETRQGAVTTTSIETHRAVPMMYFMALACIVARERNVQVDTLRFPLNPYVIVPLPRTV